ncbi:hypothetical protein EAKF1_ch1084c [Escherichia albertii KF1]|nr:hypothetical protein EAKF1_ch1084c [Escherichia albertii KF1]
MILLVRKNAFLSKHEPIDIERLPKGNAGMPLFIIDGE